MAKVRQLARAPLREALIDLQFEAPLDADFVVALSDRAVPGFEKKNEIRQFSIKLFPSGESQDQRLEEVLGWRFESRDGNRVAQLRRNGMTYSILKEYTEWSDIKSAAQAVWKLYSEWAGQKRISRVAVRYVNVLELPPGTELSNYLTAPPQVPPGLPHALTHFLERIVIPFDQDIFAIIIQTLEPTNPNAKTPVILDIDVYARCSFAVDSPALWVFMDRLRDVKNEVFFSSVTEQALGTYENE